MARDQPSMTDEATPALPSGLKSCVKQSKRSRGRTSVASPNYYDATTQPVPDGGPKDQDTE